MDKLFLWFIGLLDGVWRRLGADPRSVRLLVQAKMRIAGRPTRVLGKQQDKSSLIYLLYIMMFLGGLAIPFAYWLGDHPPTVLGISYSFVMLYFAFIIIAELSDQLFDERDVMLLLSRPVSDRTLGLARGLWVGSTIAKFFFFVFLPVGVLILVVDPLRWPLFLLGVLCCFVMLVGGVLLLYMGLFNRLSPKRFREVIGYVQMVAGFFFAIIYILPQFFTGDYDPDGEGWRWVGEWTGYLFPGLWAAALFDVEGWAAGNFNTILQAALAVGGAAGAGVYYIKQADNYGTQLVNLRMDGGEPEEAPEPGTDGPTVPVASPLRRRLGTLFTRPGVERATFNFHWAMMTRSLAYKQALYPALASIPVFILFFAFRDYARSEDGAEMNIFFTLFGLYYCGLALVMPLSTARTTTQPEAGWLWLVHPTENHLGSIKYAQTMAGFVLYLLPIVLIVYPVFLWLGGWALLDDILLSLGVNLIAVVTYQSMDNILPFSKTKEEAGTNQFVPLIGMMAVAGFGGVAHYALQRFLPWAMLPAAVLAVGVAVVMVVALRRNL